jgi:putative GTP pyrophosphokinase
MSASNPSAKALEQAYRRRYLEVLKPLEDPLREHVADLLRSQPRIDRVSARAKDVRSFITKANSKNGINRKYSEPLHQIQDQIGVRIITFYLRDVEQLSAEILKCFRAIEEKEQVPDSEWEFGYFGKHYILLLPKDVIDDKLDKTMVPRVFELQIKTLFQHAWSEAEHDLGYKPGQVPLSTEQKRRLAFTSAQAWGADQIFNDLVRERPCRE